MLSPTDLPGLRAWFDATSLVQAHGSDVATWPDSGPDQRPATFQGTGRAQFRQDVLAGQPGVYFPGGASLQTIFPYTVNPPFTIYVVAQSLSSATGQNFFSGVNSAHNALGYVYNGFLTFGANKLVNSGPQVLPMPYPVRAAFVFNGASSTSYLGAVPGGVGDVGSASLQGLRLGVSQTYYLVGYLFELIVFAGMHDPSTVYMVDCYLRSKWTFGGPTPDPTPPREGQLICYGDSLTAGYGVGDPIVDSWPGKVASLRPAALAKNYGVSGLLLGDLITWYPSRIHPLFGPTRLRNVIGIQGGWNDLIAGQADPETILSRWRCLVAMARSSGFQVIAQTMTAGNLSVQPADAEASRQAINTAIRAGIPGPYGDAVADAGGDAILGDPANTGNATYWQSDQLHLTPAGYSLVAPYFQSALATLPAIILPPA